MRFFKISFLFTLSLLIHLAAPLVYADTVSKYLWGRSNCFDHDVTADQICKTGGYQGAIEGTSVQGYWWWQCAGPSLKAETCSDGLNCDVASADCTGVSQQPYPQNYIRSGDASTTFNATDPGSNCTGQNPGWVIRAACRYDASTPPTSSTYSGADVLVDDTTVIHQGTVAGCAGGIPVTKTPEQICQEAGYAGASSSEWIVAKAYFWAGCGGAKLVSCNGLDCFPNDLDCTNSVGPFSLQLPYPSNYVASLGALNPLTMPTSNPESACRSWNPGWTVRVSCRKNSEAGIDVMTTGIFEVATDVAPGDTETIASPVVATYGDLVNLGTTEATMATIYEVVPLESAPVSAENVLATEINNTTDEFINTTATTTTATGIYLDEIPTMIAAMDTVETIATPPPADTAAPTMATTDTIVASPTLVTLVPVSSDGTDTTSADTPTVVYQMLPIASETTVASDTTTTPSEPATTTTITTDTTTATIYEVVPLESTPISTVDVFTLAEEASTITDTTTTTAVDMPAEAATGTSVDATVSDTGIYLDEIPTITTDTTATTAATDTTADTGTTDTTTTTGDAGGAAAAPPNLCANVTCTASDQCHEPGVCDPATGQCSNPAKADGSVCNDDNACTTDACVNGACVGTDNKPVVAAGSCKKWECTANGYVEVSDDTVTCSDDNLCTQTDRCQNGVCVGADPVTCSAPDACYMAGTCEPTTGACEGQTVLDGKKLGESCVVGIGGCERTGEKFCKPDGSTGCNAVPGTPSTEICINGVDDDCDGSIDEGCNCNDGDTESCYGGPATTQGKGVCKAGTQTCSTDGEWGACEGQVLPATTETCDGLDNDCNGKVDDGIALKPVANVEGSCINNTEYCDATTHGSYKSSPTNHVPAAKDSCAVKGDDSDCNGIPNEGCPCVTGDTQTCYTGRAGTDGVASCHGGTQTCTAGVWDACQGEVTPQPETCNDKDDDCNGKMDDGIAPMLTSKQEGLCKGNTKICQNGSLVDSPNNYQPTQDTCDGKDENCDGTPDGGCVCINGQTQSCYTGAATTKNVGACKDGAQTCTEGTWGACTGQILPSQEICDGKDNDCNGVADDVLAAVTTTCGVGACASTGEKKCINGSWNADSCTPKEPTTEVCGDGVDNDCNNQIDENCPAKCADGAKRSCYTGPATTRNVSPCHDGTETCTGGVWEKCEGQVLPAAEVCDGLDNDCSGKADDGLNNCGSGSSSSSTTSTTPVSEEGAQTPSPPILSPNPTPTSPNPTPTQYLVGGSCSLRRH